MASDKDALPLFPTSANMLATAAAPPSSALATATTTATTIAPATPAAAPALHATEPSPATVDDPRPQPPIEPQLEDCCGSGCVVCVFDAYEMSRDRYVVRLAAWLARHPDAVTLP